MQANNRFRMFCLHIHKNTRTHNPLVYIFTSATIFFFSIRNLLSRLQTEFPSIRQFSLLLSMFIVCYCLSFFCVIFISIGIQTHRRFVEPFSDLIRSWEKTISLIFEIIDQWVNFTQRKWLYLEGIFVNNDARIKLPAIAAKFDLIDDEYIKVFISIMAKEMYTQFCLHPIQSSSIDHNLIEFY